MWLRLFFFVYVFYMAKKRGGSPASRNVMRQIKLGKETHLKDFPILNEKVPKSVLPYISAGGSRRRRRRRRRTRKGGSPLSKSVQAIVNNLASSSDRSPLDTFPSLDNYGTNKNTIKIPEIHSGPFRAPCNVMGHLQSDSAKKSNPVGGRKKRSRKSKKKLRRRRSKRGGSAFKSTLYSWSLNPSDQKNLKIFSPDAVQYSPTSSNNVNKTVMFKPFKKGGRRRSI